MTRVQAFTLGLSFLLLTEMGLYLRHEFRLSTGLADLLVKSEEKELASISSQLMDSTLVRTMILRISAPKLTDAIAASDTWSAELRAHPEVESLRTGPDELLPRTVFDLYFPRRLGFASSRPEQEIPERLSEAGLAASARHLKNELAGPRGTLLKETAAADPFLLFPSIVNAFEQAEGGPLGVQAGHFITTNPRAAVLFLTTRHSAFDAVHQAPLDRFLQQSSRRLEQENSAQLTVERAGVHRFAVASENQARSDMQRISVLSTFAVAALFLAVFPSVRLFVLAVIPPTAGVLLALTTSLAWFDELHVMTLVFGSTLIGVCIDYPIHYLNHHASACKPSDPWRSLREVRPALILGAITSAVGFGALAASRIPGVREIGVFAAVGVLGALAVTCVILPVLLPTNLQQSHAQTWLLSRLTTFDRAGPAHSVRLAMWGSLALLLASGFARLQWQDDVFALNVANKEGWLAEDARVGEAVSRMDLGRFVAVIGNDVEDVLRKNDEVFTRLEDARQQGEIESFLSLHTLLRSADLQKRNLKAFEVLRRDPGRMLRAYRDAGFRPAAFEPFLDTLAKPSPPLRYQDLSGGPLEPLVERFVLEADKRFTILTFLRRPSEGADLSAAFADLEDVHYFDQRSVLRNLYAEYRAQALVLVVFGMLGVVGLLVARERDVHRTLALAAPAILAAAGTLAIFGLLGIPVNLLHLLGLLLVLGIGVDYAIFLLSFEPGSPSHASSRLSIIMAAASTSAVFGMLSFSSYPALRSLGTATCIGVLLSVLFSFAARSITATGSR